MAELKDSKRKNGKLSLYPLKFEKAVEDLLKVKPEAKAKEENTKIIVAKEREK